MLVRGDGTSMCTFSCVKIKMLLSCMVIETTSRSTRAPRYDCRCKKIMIFLKMKFYPQSTEIMTKLGARILGHVLVQRWVVRMRPPPNRLPTVRPPVLFVRSSGKAGDFFNTFGSCRRTSRSLLTPRARADENRGGKRVASGSPVFSRPPPPQLRRQNIAKAN